MPRCESEDHAPRYYGWLVNILALLLLVATLLLPNLYLYSPYFPRDIQAETPVLLGEVAEIDKISISHQQDQFGPFINLNMVGRFHKNLAANDKFIISTRVESQFKEFDFTFLIKKQLTDKNCVTSNLGCQIIFSRKIYIPSSSTAENLHIMLSLHLDKKATRPAVITERINLSDNAASIPLKTIFLGLLSMLVIMYFTSHLFLLQKKEGWLSFIVTQIFVGNLFFILLSILVSMPCSLFLYWSCYHATEFYLTWVLVITGWLASGFFGPIRYTGPTFVIMLAIGIFLNRIKIEVFHTQIGGDDLRNLISLAEVISNQSSLLTMSLSGGAIAIISLSIMHLTLIHK